MADDPAANNRTTDEELRALDVSQMLRYGLTRGGAHRTALFGDGAVSAALQAEDLGVVPRSLSYLGEVVRRGGIRTAADLPEPLPGRDAAALANEWLVTAASVVENADVERAEDMARWLEATASVLALRRQGSAG